MPHGFCQRVVLPFLGFLFVVSASHLRGEEPPRAAAAPQWFKGNLHTHSLWSDGNDFPEMIADWYRGQGYNFLALSDHNVLSQGTRWIKVAEAQKRGAIGGLERYRKRFGDGWVERRTVDGEEEVRLKPLAEFRPLVEESGKFLLIPSEEISDQFESLPIHINATNLLEVIKPQRGGSLQETIANNLEAVENQRKRTGQAMIAHLNHPNYQYAVTAEDLAAVIRERFVEVYNGHPQVGHKGDQQHASTEVLWDVANTLRIAEMKAPPLFGLAVDDAHNYFGNRDSSPGRGWVMVRAGHLTPESIVAALEQGDFYASSGVTLRDVRYTPESRTLALDIAPQPGATYETRFIGTPANYDRRREPVTDAAGAKVRATQRYSGDVGRVLATVQGDQPRYQLTGDELYVRAVVTSNLAPENPSFKDQKQQAWTQPVGWETRVTAAAANK